MPNFKRLTQSACNDSALQRRFTVNLNLISALKDIQLLFTMTPRSRRQVRRNFAQIFLAAGGSLPPQRKRPNRPQLLLAASPGRIIGGGSCADPFVRTLGRAAAAGRPSLTPRRAAWSRRTRQIGFRRRRFSVSRNCRQAVQQSARSIETFRQNPEERHASRNFFSRHHLLHLF